MTQHRNLPDGEPEHVMVPYAHFNTLKFPDKHRLRVAAVIVGDLIPERLEQARSFGCETIDVSKGDPSNATVISLDEAPQGYDNFDQGAARKYVLNLTA